MRRSAALIGSFLVAVCAAASAGAAAPTPAGVVGGWKGGPAKENGADYCVQEARFSSGHLLMVGRTRTGEVNLALGIPGAALPVGERWKVTVAVDGADSRERVATAASKALLVIGMGFDAEFFDRLKKGKTLTLKASADDIALQLSGTGKALGELEKCAAALPEAGTAGKVASGLPGGAGAPPFPETLTAILAAAGLREVQTLAFPDLPPEKRPADYAWRVGKVLGGMRERNVPPGTDFDEITTAYAGALKDRCKGGGTVTQTPVERLTGVTLRSAAVDCAGEDGKGGVHVALVSYLSDAHLFAVFFHESAPAHKAEADDIRDRLAQVFRNVARMDQQDAAAPPQSARPSPPPAKPQDVKPVQAPTPTPAQAPVQAGAAPAETPSVETPPPAHAAPVAPAPVSPPAASPPAVVAAPPKTEPAGAGAPRSAATETAKSEAAKSEAPKPPAQHSAPAPAQAPPASAPAAETAKAEPVGSATPAAAPPVAAPPVVAPPGAGPHGAEPHGAEPPPPQAVPAPQPASPAPGVETPASPPPQTEAAPPVVAPVPVAPSASPSAPAPSGVPVPRVKPSVPAAAPAAGPAKATAPAKPAAPVKSPAPPVAAHGGQQHKAPAKSTTTTQARPANAAHGKPDPVKSPSASAKPAAAPAKPAAVSAQ